MNTDLLKITVLEDKTEDYLELVVSTNYIKTIFLSFLIFKDSIPKINVKLAKREKEVLEYMADGKNNREISEYMNISVHTVKAYVSNILQKFEVTDRTQAVVQAIKYNIIDI